VPRASALSGKSKNWPILTRKRYPDKWTYQVC
jgi:hypothetical protein